MDLTDLTGLFWELNVVIHGMCIAYCICSCTIPFFHCFLQFTYSFSLIWKGNWGNSSCLRKNYKQNQQRPKIYNGWTCSFVIPIVNRGFIYLGPTVCSTHNGNPLGSSCITQIVCELFVYVNFSQLFPSELASDSQSTHGLLKYYLHLSGISFIK